MCFSLTSRQGWMTAAGLWLLGTEFVAELGNVFSWIWKQSQDRKDGQATNLSVLLQRPASSSQAPPLKVPSRCSATSENSIIAWEASMQTCACGKRRPLPCHQLLLDRTLGSASFRSVSPFLGLSRTTSCFAPTAQDLHSLHSICASLSLCSSPFRFQEMLPVRPS